MAIKKYVHLVIEGVSEPQRIQADEIKVTGIGTYDLMKDGKKVAEVSGVNSYWFEEVDTVTKVKQH